MFRGFVVACKWLFPTSLVLFAACGKVDEPDEADEGAPAASARQAVPRRADAVPARPSVGQQSIDLIDERFGRPMPAVALKAPAGWPWEGGVRWDHGTQCVGNQLRVEWQGQSPDQSHALELMRAFHWQVAGRSVQLNPCPVLPFASTRAFLEAVVQQRRPGARVLEYRDRPDAAQAAAAAAKPGPARVRHEAGEILIAMNVGGRASHELLSTVVTFSELQGTVMGASGLVVAQRSPEGRLDPAVGRALAESIKPHAEWQQVMMQAVTQYESRRAGAQRQDIERWHASEMARINAQGEADRAAIRSQTQRDVARIHSETNANTQATNDRIHRRNMEGLGEYNTYRDSSGNGVRSSIHGGDRVFRHGDGSYSSTRDPYVQPPGAEELKRQR